MFFPEHTVRSFPVLSHLCHHLCGRNRPRTHQAELPVVPPSLWIWIWAFLKLVFSFFLIHFHFWYVGPDSGTCCVQMFCVPSQVPAQSGPVGKRECVDLCACVARDQANASGMLGKYQAAFPTPWFWGRWPWASSNLSTYTSHRLCHSQPAFIELRKHRKVAERRLGSHWLFHVGLRWIWFRFLVRKQSPLHSSPGWPETPHLLHSLLRSPGWPETLHLLHSLIHARVLATLWCTL